MCLKRERERNKEREREEERGVVSLKINEETG